MPVASLQQDDVGFVPFHVAGAVPRVEDQRRVPDYVVVAETMGEQCGVALITRELASRYPFLQAR